MTTFWGRQSTNCCFLVNKGQFVPVRLASNVPNTAPTESTVLEWWFRREIYADTFDARLNERLAAGLYDRENAGIPQEKSLTEPGPFEGGKSGMGVPGGVTEVGRGRGREGLPTANLVGLGAGTDETLR